MWSVKWVKSKGSPNIFGKMIQNIATFQFGKKKTSKKSVLQISCPTAMFSRKYSGKSSSEAQIFS